MNILIVTGKFGMGHWSASISLRQQLLRSFPEAQVEVMDLIAYTSHNPESMYKWFNVLVTRGSGLFNLYYKFTQNKDSDERPLNEEQCPDRVEELFAVKRPDVVIATHPICARIVARWKQETGSSLPLVTCVTDLTSHSEWIHRDTDCYLVGTEEIKERLAEKGVDRDIIYVTGIPVRAEFKLPVHRGERQERNLLIMGGGLGMMPRKDSFYEALDSMPGVNTTVITGRNQKLYDRLVGKYPHINVVGFTDRVYEYMAWADLVLTKPGGITVFESIFSELPILAWEPFLEQEKRNARFLVERGMGRVAAKEPDECLMAIRELIYDDDTLADMSAKMHAMKEQLEQERLIHILARLTAGRGVCA